MLLFVHACSLALKRHLSFHADVSWSWASGSSVCRASTRAPFLKSSSITAIPQSMTATGTRSVFYFQPWPFASGSALSAIKSQLWWREVVPTLMCDQKNCACWVIALWPKRGCFFGVHVIRLCWVFFFSLVIRFAFHASEVWNEGRDENSSTVAFLCLCWRLHSCHDTSLPIIFLQFPFAFKLS